MDKTIIIAVVGSIVILAVGLGIGIGIGVAHVAPSSGKNAETREEVRGIADKLHDQISNENIRENLQ